MIAWLSIINMINNTYHKFVNYLWLCSDESMLSYTRTITRCIKYVRGIIL